MNQAPQLVSPPPCLPLATPSKASCSKAGRLEEIPKNLKELLATSLLNGQLVKYITEKGKIRWSGRWLRELGMTAERRTSAGGDARARAWSSWRCRGRGRQPGTRRAVQSAGALRQPAERRHRAWEPAGVHGSCGGTVPGLACVHSISSRSGLRRICML